MRIIRPFVGNAIEVKDNMFIGKMAAFISGLESNSGHCDRQEALDGEDETMCFVAITFSLTTL